MPGNTPRVCIDRIVPLALAGAARQAARGENSNNRAGALEAAGVKSKFWKPGRRLKVAFLDGHPDVQERVIVHAREWEKYANIHFEFGNHAAAELRISFEQPGSWSALGTDALVEVYFPTYQPTINFGWLGPESSDEDYGVVYHEFGHALGLIHEHQNPQAGIRWNERAVIEALSGPPNNWDEPTIRHNVIDTYSRRLTQFTEFDPESIMLYFFPPEWTLDGQSFRENKQISPTDQRFIRARYPANHS